MAILKVLSYPDSFLKTKGTPVTLFDEDLKVFLDDMVETMYDSVGIGLAATQVGSNKRLFVMDLMIIWKKKRTILKYKNQTIEVFKKARDEGSRVYIVASGTSYHAALTAAVFKDRLKIVSCNKNTGKRLKNGC